MSVGDIFWLFFIFSALQPMLRTAHTRGHAGAQNFLDRKRTKSRAIPLVHRQETMRFLGFPIARYVDINDSEDAPRCAARRADSSSRTPDRQSGAGAQGQGHRACAAPRDVGRYADRARRR